MVDSVRGLQSVERKAGVRRLTISKKGSLERSPGLTVPTKSTVNAGRTNWESYFPHEEARDLHPGCTIWPSI